MKRFLAAVAAFSAAAWAGYAQEILREGDASYASYTPWSKARTFDADGKVVRRGEQRIAAGNSLSIVYDFPGLLPCWAAPRARKLRVKGLRRNTGYGISLFSLSVYGSQDKPDKK